MRNFWKKLTASLLALVLTVQLLPVSALTDEFEIDDERHDTFTYEQPDVSGEISELRGEYEKHFSLSDGTYSAVVYPYPVHYDSNGTWQEIDNTLRFGSGRAGSRACGASASRAGRRAYIAYCRGGQHR